MKYMVLTAKHHDGFCFWDTAQTDFKITNLANPHTGMGGDDECGCASCRADRPVIEDLDPAQAKLSRYLLFMRRQLEELVTRYGPPALLWFDGQEHPPVVGGTAELIKLLRGLKSDLLINDRISTAPGQGDFAIHEWNIPQERQMRDWESCLCVNGSWAFNANDLGWKPTCQLIRELIEIVSLGGNLLLNVGPDQDGVIPAVSVARLQEMGNWLRVNGEAIYGTTAGIRDATGSWRFTRKGDVDYAIALEWPVKGVVIPGMRLHQHGTVSLLGVETKLTWENIGADCQIKVPTSIHMTRPSAHAWVFKLTGGLESI